jgi:hypothetical protein
MNVKELRELIAHFPDDLPVVVEVTFDEGSGFEGAPLQTAEIESRCDEVERLYLWGDQEEEDNETVEPNLKLVT